MLRCAALVLAVLMWARVAPAQIYEWRDADGSRHFTTDVEDLPADQRQKPRIVVRQSAWGSEQATDAPAPPAPRDQAQVVYDHSLRRPRADSAARDGGGGVYIQGPLAVANVDFSPPSADRYGREVAVLPLAYPLVNTSFDRGRSRHLTLRMLLQDQFQLDRDGPYFYERVGGATPQFRAFLPRGLPRHYPRGGVVVTR